MRSMVGGFGGGHAPHHSLRERSPSPSKPEEDLGLAALSGVPKLL